MPEIDDSYYRKIPQNVLSKGKFFGIPYANWIEGIVSAALIGNVVFFIPFVLKVKIICCAVLCSAIIAANLHGINNRDIVSFFFDFARDRTSIQKFTLGSVDNADKRKKQQSANQFGTMSLLEQLTDTIKSKAKSFDERYGQEDAAEEESND